MTSCAARGPSPAGHSGPERSLAFAYYHANKRGIVLDYRSPEALGMLAELGASADVVLLTPPVTGFDPDSRELSWAAPDAVVCAITPFGLTGPYRSWGATHLTSCALGGGDVPVRAARRAAPGHAGPPAL